MDLEQIVLLILIFFAGFFVGRLLLTVLGVYLIAWDIKQQEDLFYRRIKYCFWLHRAKSTGTYGRWWLRKHRDQLLGGQDEEIRRSP